MEVKSRDLGVPQGEILIFLCIVCVTVGQRLHLPKP